MFQTKNTNKKQKKLKKIKKQKKPKKQRRKKMLLLLTTSTENLTRYDMSCENLFCVVLTYLIKRGHVLKTINFEKTFVCFCFLYVQDKRLYLYILFALTFQLLILEWSNVVPCRLLCRHCLKHFRESQKNIFLFSHVF